MQSKFFFLPVLCPIMTWVIMVLHNVPCRSKQLLFLYYPFELMFCHSFTHSCYAGNSLFSNSLSLLPSLYHVSFILSEPIFLIMCLGNFSSSFLFVPVFFKLPRYSHVQSMVFSLSFCRTIIQLLQVISSSVMIFSSTHCQIIGFILHRR